MSEQPFTLEDLEAILQDLEDICARIPSSFRFHHAVSMPVSPFVEAYIEFSCSDHRYRLTIVEHGRARQTRIVTREQLLSRLEGLTGSGAYTLGSLDDEGGVVKF